MRVRENNLSSEVSMNQHVVKIDLVKLFIYMLKRSWIIILCAIIGFFGWQWYKGRNVIEMYTASGTMYVQNGNPNLINYGYTNETDLNSAVHLIETYTIVVKSNKVMDVIAERLAATYPDISPDYIRSTISMSSVAETGVVRVTCRTPIPQMSADICNAVIDVAPAEIIRVVGAGNIEVVDYATVPFAADGINKMRRGMVGAMAAAFLAIAVLLVLFLLDRKISDTKELTENFTPPVLASIRRIKGPEDNPSLFLLDEGGVSPDQTENFARLRMNLLFALGTKDRRIIVVTSAVPGEGKSTISANLAISCAEAGKKILLIDGDMRRASQRDLFQYDDQLPGLSELLINECSFSDALTHTQWEKMDILPAGKLPPNPAELLASERMAKVLEDAEASYDLVVIDMPPVNIVSDALVVSKLVTGCLFVVRQKYSDDKEIRKALVAAEMTNMDVLGFVFYGEKIHTDSYYNRKHYHKYYNHYYRQEPQLATVANAQEDTAEIKDNK